MLISLIVGGLAVGTVHAATLQPLRAVRKAARLREAAFSLRSHFGEGRERRWRSSASARACFFNRPQKEQTYDGCQAQSVDQPHRWGIGCGGQFMPPLFNLSER